MNQYFKFKEYNDWEGETWIFWINTKNEEFIEFLR